MVSIIQFKLFRKFNNTGWLLKEIKRKAHYNYVHVSDTILFFSWSDYSKQVGGQFIRIRLKIAKKCWLYVDIFSCVKINVFRSFFAFRLEMHVRCDNQYKAGADRGNILGQPMLFVCMGICVFSPVIESEMRGYLVYMLIVKQLSH